MFIKVIIYDILSKNKFNVFNTNSKGNIENIIDILSEFEKWLIKILNTASAEEYMLFMSCLNKLEELKGEE